MTAPSIVLKQYIYSCMRFKQFSLILSMQCEYLNKTVRSVVQLFTKQCSGTCRISSEGMQYGQSGNYLQKTLIKLFFFFKSMLMSTLRGGVIFLSMSSIVGVNSVWLGLGKSVLIINLNSHVTIMHLRLTLQTKRSVRATVQWNLDTLKHFKTRKPGKSNAMVKVKTSIHHMFT